MDLTGVNFRGIDLSGACLSGTKLRKADLREANLTKAELVDADLSGADLRRSIMRDVDLSEANLSEANLTQVDLARSTMRQANLREAILREANLAQADLQMCLLAKTDLRDANLSGCRVYGVSAWNLELDGSIQSDLIITLDDEKPITVDNIEVAQVLYMMLTNVKVRDFFGAMSKKGVLLLGRFTNTRVIVLDRLRDELRKRGFVPIVFNFDQPEVRDFTGTVKMLASLSHFIIADITNTRSTPFELQETVPEFEVPLIPIIEEGNEAFPMFADLWNKYRDRVLEPRRYRSVDGLVRALDDAIIKPALMRSAEMMTRKAIILNIRDI